VFKVKRKIIFENRNKNAEQKNVSKEFENEIIKSIFLVLKERGYLTQKQYEECLKKLKA
jgi:ribosomal protein S8